MHYDVNKLERKPLVIYSLQPSRWQYTPYLMNYDWPLRPVRFLISRRNKILSLPMENSKYQNPQNIVIKQNVITNFIISIVARIKRRKKFKLDQDQIDIKLKLKLNRTKLNVDGSK